MSFHRRTRNGRGRQLTLGMNFARTALVGDGVSIVAVVASSLMMMATGSNASNVSVAATASDAEVLANSSRPLRHGLLRECRRAMCQRSRGRDEIRSQASSFAATALAAAGAGNAAVSDESSRPTVKVGPAVAVGRRVVA
jgi:hypothetical protein